MAESNRISSISIMRGLTLLLLLFANDLYLPGVQVWLANNVAGVDRMHLADWVFPGFLFMVGMTIPFSIGNKISEKQETFSIVKHIIRKTISLLVIGVLMINSDRVNTEITGLSKNLWTIFMYAGVFLVWNKYTENDKNFFTLSALRLAGLAILVALVLKFSSGRIENNGSLITGSWGIFGVIGWGYLIAALVYLAVRNSILNTVVAIFFFLAFNILSSLNLLDSIKIIKPVFGVIIEGSVPLFVLSGVFTTLLLDKYSETNFPKLIISLVTIGVISILAGLVLKNLFIVAKMPATPGWVLICTGLSILLFSLLYWIIDIKKQIKWSFFLKSAGENSFTTYITASVLYCLISLTGIPILIYKQSGVPLLAIGGSFIWALVSVGLASLLARYNIRLKL
jgi:heparan-alpha-glucosaminide N-acetyltransferase